MPQNRHFIKPKPNNCPSIYTRHGIYNNSKFHSLKHVKKKQRWREIQGRSNQLKLFAKKDEETTKSDVWSRRSYHEWWMGSSSRSKLFTLECSSTVGVPTVARWMSSDLEMRKQIMPARRATRAAKRWNPMAIIEKNMPNWHGVFLLALSMTFWAKERNEMIKGWTLLVNQPCKGDMRNVLTARTRMLNSDERLPSSRRCFSVNSIWRLWYWILRVTMFRTTFETVAWLGT